MQELSKDIVTNRYHCGSRTDVQSERDAPVLFQTHETQVLATERIDLPHFSLSCMASERACVFVCRLLRQLQPTIK